MNIFRYVTDANLTPKSQKLLLAFFLVTMLSCLAIGVRNTTLVPSWIPIMKEYLMWILAGVIYVFTYWNHEMTVVRMIKVLLPISVFMFNSADVVSGGFQPTNVLTIILLVSFAFLENYDLVLLVKLFRKFIILISILGIIISLDFFLGLGLPYEINQYYANGINANYLNYYISYLYLDNVGVRLCGIFNEPGSFGTVLALMLIIDKFNLRHKGNYLMFTAGCFTMSMAFFMLVIVGMILFSLKNVKALLFAVTLIFSFVYVLPEIHFEDKSINHLIERFQFDSTSGTFKGDNRESYSFDIVYQEFESKGNKIIGEGTGYCNAKNVKKTSTYKKYIVEWGYLGFLLTYGLLIFAAILAAKINIDALILVFCFAMSIYQRPLVFTIPYFLILFGGIAWRQEKSLVIDSAKEYEIANN